MRFLARKRRQPPAIIIVALIDILIVLLIFLMVTTAFKQQPALKMVLPESTQASKSGVNDTAPLVVSIDTAGILRLGPDAKAMSAEELQQKLVAALAANPELKLAISADTAAPFGQIVRVMDAAKAAGIKAVNAFTKEPARP
jgi:biopolymer transport protein ExbD